MSQFLKINLYPGFLSMDTPDLFSLISLLPYIHSRDARKSQLTSFLSAYALLLTLYITGWAHAYADQLLLCTKPVPTLKLKTTASYDCSCVYGSTDKRLDSAGQLWCSVAAGQHSVSNVWDYHNPWKFDVPRNITRKKVFSLFIKSVLYAFHYSF